MNEPDRQVETAVALMRQALALLDSAGETCGAAALQGAIDATTRAPIPRTEADIDPELIAQFERGDFG